MIFPILLLLAGFYFSSQTAFAQSLPSSASDGVKQYNREEFEEAITSFEKAKSREPDNPLVAYNLANSHYRMGNYDQAVQAYNEAENNLKDPKLKVQSLYNKGNALFRLGYLGEAIESYKKALELNPDDMDSKFNLEFARNMLERAEQGGRVMPRDPGPSNNSMPGGINPPAPNEEPGDENEKGRSPSTKTENGPDKLDPDAEENQSADEGQDPSSQEPSQPDSNSEPPDPAKDHEFAQALEDATTMTGEEAEQWLNSLDENLKKYAQRQIQGQMKDVFVSPQKDW